MIALLVILLILGILLLTPIRLCIAYSQQTVQINARIGWIRLHIFPKEKKSALKENAKPKKKKRKYWTDKKTIFSKQRISEKLQLLKTGLHAARLFLGQIAIDDISLRLTVAGTDASKTALLYGRLSAIFGAIHALLDRYLNLKSCDMHIGVDFYQEKIQAEGYAVFSFLPYSAFGALFCFLFALLRIEMKKKPLNFLSRREL